MHDSCPLSALGCRLLPIIRLRTHRTMYHRSGCLRLTMSSRASYIYKSYSQDEPNVPGALLFLAYIVAALYFSLRVWIIIWNRYTSIRAKSSARERLKIFTSFCVTLLSFTVLSYNMLLFLIISYKEWAQRHAIQGNPLLEPALLWQWMSHSTLFEDFARSLIATPARSVWTQLALLQTYQIVTGMYKGTQSSICIQVPTFL